MSQDGDLSKQMSQDSDLFKHCCWFAVMRSGLIVSNGIRHAEDVDDGTYRTRKTAKTILEANFATIPTELRILTPPEKSWIRDLGVDYDEPSRLQYSTAGERYRSRQISSRGYLLLSKNVFQDANLPSSPELMGKPVFDALNKYFDDIIAKKHIHELTQSTLMMRCCDHILNESFGAGQSSKNLVEKIMDANFPSEWRESTGSPEDEGESKWFSHYWSGIIPEEMKTLKYHQYNPDGDAWYREQCVEKALRKGTILLLHGAFHGLELPSNPEVMEQRLIFLWPFEDILNNYFDYVAEEKKIDVSEKVDDKQLKQLALPYMVQNDRSEDGIKQPKMGYFFLWSWFTLSLL